MNTPNIESDIAIRISIERLSEPTEINSAKDSEDSDPETASPYSPIPLSTLEKERALSSALSKLARSIAKLAWPRKIILPIPILTSGGAERMLSILIATGECEISASLSYPFKLFDAPKQLLKAELLLSLHLATRFSGRRVSRLFLGTPLTANLTVALSELISENALNQIICTPEIHQELSHKLPYDSLQHITLSRAQELTIEERLLSQSEEAALNEIVLSLKSPKSTIKSPATDPIAQAPLFLDTQKGFANSPFLLRRLEQLISDFLAWQTTAQQNLLGEALRAKYAKALSLLLQTLSSASLEKSAFALSTKTVFLIERKIVASQVALDELLYPDVDPAHGWVRNNLPGPMPNNHQSTHCSYVDTQLMRLYFDRESPGDILCWEYKPRKIDLVARILHRTEAGREIGCGGPTIVDMNMSKEMDRIDPAHGVHNCPLITRRTPDIIGARYKRSFRSDETRGEIDAFVEYTIHAGIGAFRPFSTTGFSAEYWLESGTSNTAALSLSINFNLRLPTPDPNVYMTRLLLAVGAVSEEAYYCDTPQRFTPQSQACSIFGLRVVDGIDGTYIDFRFSRQLIKIETTTRALSTSGAANGNAEHATIAAPSRLETPDSFLKIVFEIPATQVETMDRSISLFTSIN